MKQKSETWNRKLSGGVEGLTAHRDAARKQRGRETGQEFFTGGATLAARAAVAAVDDWEWVGAARPWTRKRMGAYLKKWLTDNKLLRGPIDAPAFTQLVEISLLIQKAEKLRDAEKDPEKQIAIGRQVIELWGKARGAVKSMNLRDAQEAAESAASDVSEAYLAQFESPPLRPRGSWDPVAKRVVPAHNGDTEI